MARKVFFSFHYVPDNWRASQIRQIGAIEGNRPCSDNDWESVTKGGDKAIKKWIEDQLYGKSCVVVLVGAGTAGRKWITHEIKTAWEAGKAVVGVRIHNLKDSAGNQSSYGGNPFDHLSLNNQKMSSIVKVYDPPYVTSTYVYDHIKENIADWIEKAIEIRAKYD